MTILSQMWYEPWTVRWKEFEAEEDNVIKWIDNIKEDLKAYNLDMRTATDLLKTERCGEMLSQRHHRLVADGSEERRRRSMM